MVKLPLYFLPGYCWQPQEYPHRCLLLSAKTNTKASMVKTAIWYLPAYCLLVKNYNHRCLVLSNKLNTKISMFKTATCIFCLCITGRLRTMHIDICCSSSSFLPGCLCFFRQFINLGLEPLTLRWWGDCFTTVLSPQARISVLKKWPSREFKILTKINS